jgi:hypothetical protein
MAALWPYRLAGGGAKLASAAGPVIRKRLKKDDILGRR